VRAPSRNDAVDELHGAVGEMLGAERRLRSRDKATVDGLTIGQIRALMALKRKSEATAGDLARAADVTPATMTAMLDQLDGAGIVVRARSDHDRRVVMVSLTEHGQALVAKRRRAWEARWREALADVSDDEVLAAAAVMRRIAGLFDSVGAD
jgi:MarR family transcriptional regulator, organic hydroperoxide resistance regulator